jgi:hypothetical protein
MDMRKKVGTKNGYEENHCTRVDFGGLGLELGETVKPRTDLYIIRRVIVKDLNPNNVGVEHRD